MPSVKTQRTFASRPLDRVREGDLGGIRGRRGAPSRRFDAVPKATAHVPGPAARTMRTMQDADLAVGVLQFIFCSPSLTKIHLSLLRRARLKPRPRRTRAVDSAAIRHSFDQRHGRLSCPSEQPNARAARSGVGAKSSLSSRAASSTRTRALKLSTATAMPRHEFIAGVRTGREVRDSGLRQIHADQLPTTWPAPSGTAMAAGMLKLARSPTKWWVWAA
jgi:hypothetical protein